MIEDEGIPKFEENDELLCEDPSKRLDKEYRNELQLVEELRLINTSIKHDQVAMLRVENVNFEKLISSNMPSTFFSIVIEYLTLDFIIERLKKILSLNNKITLDDYNMCGAVLKSLYLLIINCDEMAEETVKRGIIEILSTFATHPIFEDKFIIYQILTKIVNVVPGTARACAEASIVSSLVADCSHLDESIVDYKSIFQLLRELSWQASISDELAIELIPFIGSCIAKSDENLLQYIFDTITNIIHYTGNVDIVSQNLNLYFIPLFAIHHFTNPQSSKVQISALNLIEKMCESGVIENPENTYMIVNKAIFDLLNSPGSDALETEAKFISAFFENLNENSIKIAEQVSCETESTKVSTDAQNIMALITDFTNIAYGIFSKRNYEVKLYIAEAFISFLNFNYAHNTENIVFIALNQTFIEFCLDILAIQKTSITIGIINGITNTVSILLFRGKISEFISNDLFVDLYNEIVEIADSSEEMAEISNSFCEILAPYKHE